MSSERIAQLLGPNFFKYAEDASNSTYQSEMFSPEVKARTFLLDGLKRILNERHFPSLCELLLRQNEVEPGTRFTIFHDFYGKGLKFNSRDPEGKKAVMAELHNKLKFSPDPDDVPFTLRIQFSSTGLCNTTAWSRLSQRTKVFVFGYIESINEKEIIARPYLIGDLHNDDFSEHPLDWDSNHYGYVHPYNIDSFSKAQTILENEKKVPDINIMKTIPEKLIKNAIGEIIHENNLPTDWGGEKSDIFSTNLRYKGKAYSAAFLLKGPADFSEMKPKHLGKNGDQIDRLFSEPCQFAILQHSHRINSSVISTMRAYASRIHDLRYFSVLDGIDTLRLLIAYEKLNLHKMS